MKSRVGALFLNLLIAAAVLIALVRVVEVARVWLRPDPAARLAGAAVHPAVNPVLPEGVTDLRTALEPIRAEHKLPALAAALVRDGRIAAIGATGVRRAGGTELVTIHDRFHIGSDTKAMTATLVAILVGDGTLSWTTTVGEVFGKRFDRMDPAWNNVTLEHLLHNRGGAPADLNAGGLWGRLWRRNGTPKAQRLELVEGVIARPPAATPGTRYIYSNAGYAVAGAIAEQLTGRAWEDLMQDRVFAPLGITTAGFGAPGRSGRTDQPLGHRTDGTPVEPGPNADNPPAIGPAGTVHMSMSDWAKFVTAHLRGDSRNPAHSPRATPLVPAEMYSRLHAPLDDYAMGWLVASRGWARGKRPADSGIVLTHAGSNTMWYCVAWLAPERDFAVLTATNQGGDQAKRGTDAAAAAIIQQVSREGRAE